MEGCPWKGHSQQSGEEDGQETVPRASMDKSTLLAEGRGGYSCMDISCAVQSQKTVWHILCNKIATSKCASGEGGQKIVHWL